MKLDKKLDTEAGRTKSYAESHIDEAAAGLKFSIIVIDVQNRISTCSLALRSEA